MSENIFGKIYTVEQGLDDHINFRAIFVKYRKKWPLFAVTIAIALLVAFVYHKYTKLPYQIKGTIVLIEKKDKSAVDKAALQELDLIGTPKVIDNEIEILKSHRLVKQVVDHLKLWVTYTTKNGFFSEDLYDQHPIEFNLYSRNIPDMNAVFKIKVLNAASYQVISEKNGTATHLFNQQVSDEFGKWELVAKKNINSFVGKTIYVNVSDPESVTTNFQNAISVAAVNKDASVIDLSINDQKINRGEDFINNLIYFYSQTELSDKNSSTKSTLDFIDKRLDSLRGELNNAEGKVEGYRSGNGLTDINAQSQIYLQDVQTNGVRLNEINIQLAVIDELEKYVNSANNETSAPTTLGIADPGLASRVQKLAEVQLEKTKLLTTLPEKNPAFESLNSQILQLKQAIKEDVKNIKSSLLTTKERLQSFKSGYKMAIQSVPGQERELGGLKRQQSIKENLYNYLLQQREEISLSYASSISNLRLLDLAYPLPPKSSKKLIPFAVALFIGLIFPAGFLYGREKYRNTINDPSELKGTAPLLADINYIKLDSEIIYDIPNKRTRFVLIEQFRHLRTRLNFLRDSQPSGNVILVTSTVSGEGKSFISNNLALAFGKAEKRTILVEIDIYKPKTAALFNLKNEKGVVDFLSGKASLDDIIQKHPSLPCLDVIACGAFLEDFSELLINQNIHELLDILRQHYDFILIDSPPISILDAAYAISALCDTTLYVVREEYTSKSMLPFIKKLHADKELPNMYIVYNGVQTVREGYNDYYPAK